MIAAKGPSTGAGAAWCGCRAWARGRAASRTVRRERVEGAGDLPDGHAIAVRPPDLAVIAAARLRRWHRGCARRRPGPRVGILDRRHKRREGRRSLWPVMGEHPRSDSLLRSFIGVQLRDECGDRGRSDLREGLLHLFRVVLAAAEQPDEARHGGLVRADLFDLHHGLEADVRVLVV